MKRKRGRRRNNETGGEGGERKALREKNGAGDMRERKERKAGEIKRKSVKITPALPRP